ncbi:hypothetical protein QE152_g35729 [Popillia japonica]|uniref:Uncharacterized protein n=1 Tax=Popillia japonica TaxID=7064 RepID=A0AAW1IF28_POPJA
MDQSLEKWMNNNPGRTVTTFQISKIFSEAYLKASVPSNAINGFKKAGIVPFNPDIFSDAEFAAAEVTEEPYEAARETIQNNAESLRTSGEKPPSPSSPIAGPSTRPDTPPILKNSTSEQSNVEVESSFTVSPADCRPVPKITGKRAAKKRKSVGTVLLTSTPYKNCLEEERKRKFATIASNGLMTSVGGSTKTTAISYVISV